MQLHDTISCRVIKCCWEIKRTSSKKYSQVKDAAPLDSGFRFLCHPLCFSEFDKLLRQSERNSTPISQAASGIVNEKLHK